MFKNWKTSLIGGIAGLTQIASVLSQTGFHIGHFGSTDFTQLVAGVGTVVIGLYAKDHNVSGK
jgi:hypothetical protein